MQSSCSSGRAGLAVALLLAASAAARTGPAAEPPASQPASQPDIRPAPPGTPPETAGIDHMIRRLERAHGADAWRRKEAVRADLHVRFGGQDMLRGTMHYDLRGGRVRLALDDGTTLVFDGRTAWVSPASAEAPMARFHLLTWPYFLAAPFKLRDPGARTARGRLRSLDGRLCETIDVTFAPGTGDTPNDWYVAYIDPASDELAAMAYVVTYGTTLAEANEDPHAILYDAPATVDGVTLCTSWRFVPWSQEEGPHGDDLGSAHLRNVRFTDLDEDLFQKPSDAREATKPK